MSPQTYAWAVLALLCATGGCETPDGRLKPPPREGTAKEDWGQAANGLRIRLVPAARTFPAGEELRFAVELQSIGRRRIELPSPRLLPVISAPGDQPYPNPKTRNLIVTATPVSHQVFIRWLRREQLPLAGEESVLLEPGGRIAVDITAHQAEQRDEERGQEDMTVTGTQKSRQPARAEFAYFGHPGKYLVEATYQVPEGGGTWAGTIRSRPVEVEVLPHGGRTTGAGTE